MGVSVQGVFVWVSMSRGGDLCAGGLCLGKGVIIHGVSVWWFLSRRVFIRVSLSGGSLSREVSVLGVSIQGVFVWESMSRGGDLCAGGLC